MLKCNIFCRKMLKYGIFLSEFREPKKMAYLHILFHSDGNDGEAGQER